MYRGRPLGWGGVLHQPLHMDEAFNLMIGQYSSSLWGIGLAGFGRQSRPWFREVSVWSNYAEP